MFLNLLFACRDNRYFNEGNEYWELLNLIEMRPDRLMMFDGLGFHSQYIQSGHYNQTFRVNGILYLNQKRKLPSFFKLPLPVIRRFFRFCRFLPPLCQSLNIYQNIIGLFVVPWFTERERIFISTSTV